MSSSVKKSIDKSQIIIERAKDENNEASHKEVDNFTPEKSNRLRDSLEDNALDLIYDHVLGCYYDPKTNMYYELKN